MPGQRSRLLSPRRLMVGRRLPAIVTVCSQSGLRDTMKRQPRVGRLDQRMLFRLIAATSLLCVQGLPHVERRPRLTANRRLVGHGRTEGLPRLWEVPRNVRLRRMGHHHMDRRNTYHSPPTDRSPLMESHPRTDPSRIDSHRVDHRRMVRRRLDRPHMDCRHMDRRHTDQCHTDRRPLENQPLMDLRHLDRHRMDYHLLMDMDHSRRVDHSRPMENPPRTEARPCMEHNRCMERPLHTGPHRPGTECQAMGMARVQECHQVGALLPGQLVLIHLLDTGIQAMAHQPATLLRMGILAIQLQASPSQAIRRPATLPRTGIPAICLQGRSHHMVPKG